MDVDCDDFYQTCRLCLSKLNGSSVSLYDDNTKSSHENNNYPYKIHFCFSISVNQKENLPNVLCQACCRDLDRFFKFKEKVLKNNTFLESYRRQNSEYARKKHKRGGSSRSHDTSSSSEKSDSRNNTENNTKHVKTRKNVEGKDNEKQLDLSVNRKVKEENEIAYNHQNGTVVRTGEYIVENDSNGAIHFVSPGKIKEESFMEDYDSEETRSANTDTCREEDEYKLIIDEDPLSSQTDNNVSVGSQDSYSENCILLKTLMSSNPMGQVQYVLQPRITDDGEKSSGRRKQKCPTKSTDIDDKTDIIREETVEDVTDISEREEVVESSHTQFIENVLARHNSPGVTPISLAPDMMNVACEVLLRAAIEIQCSSSDGQNMSPSFDHNSDTSTQQSPSMYEIDIIPNNRSVKRYRRPSKDKNQNLQIEKECSNCHAKQTTIWRRDRFGKIVCNACGLYYKLHKYDRPGRMRRDEIHKRNRKRNVNGGNGNGKLKKHKRNDSQMELSYGSPGQGYSPSTPTEHYQVSPQYETVEIFPSPNTPTNYIKQEIINVCRGTTPDSTGSNSSHSSLNNLMDQEKIMTAFQLSTHFLPISSSYETDENSINEAPLNLAASGH